MKLKYKKIILLVSMSSMGIGLITLSLSHSPRKNAVNQNQLTNVALEVQDNSNNSNNIINSDGILKIADGLIDDGTLLENAYPEINALIEKYLDARVTCDMKTIKDTVSSTNTISLESLQKESEYIEGYKNLSCYTIKALDENSFVVYVYEELKIIGIDTLAPGMTRLYVRIGPEGKPIIYFGQVDDETSDFIESTSKNVKVEQLIDSVNKRLDEAMTADKSLKDFIAGLENSAKEDTYNLEDSEANKQVDSKR